MRAAIDGLDHYPTEEKFLWLKSWNEWAEGNYLEPDGEYGDAWLDVLRNELLVRTVRD